MTSAIGVRGACQPGYVTGSTRRPTSRSRPRALGEGCRVDAAGCVLGCRDGVATGRRSQLTSTVSRARLIRASDKRRCGRSVGCHVSVRRDSASYRVLQIVICVTMAAMKARPKILAVASAVDLDFRYGCTPAWWQLWKGLHEEGVDLVVTPYRGRPVESPWWRTAPNPPTARASRSRALRDARGAAQGRHATCAAPRTAPRRRAPTSSTRELIWRWVTPRWRRHLERLVERERPRRGRRLHRADGALPRHPDGAARAVRRAGRLLRRRRADEPARVRRHGHRLQLLPRRRSVRVRPPRLELRGRARAAARARRAPRGGRLLGRRPRVLRAAAGRQGARTSSSTATATSSGATGWRRWSASRRASCPTSTSRSAAATSRATSAARA